MRRKLLLIAAAVVILAGAGAGAVLTWGSAGKETAAAPALPPATAKVTRTTLVETKKVSGTLSYGATALIRSASAQRGTLTSIASPGSTVRRGESLFKVNQRPVVALYGSLPLYRTLRDGAKGVDVRQLERNLAALGYSGVRVDRTYSAVTSRAVRAWQRKLGLPATGAVEQGQVVFTPGPVRVAGQAALVGDTVGGESVVGPHPVLKYTGTTRQVTVKLEVADQALAAKGRTVTVKVPGRPAVKGRISRVDTVVTTQGASPDQGATPDEGTTPDQGASSEGTNSGLDVSLEVTVTIADQKALGSLDVAPVDVDFFSNKREDVLAVPVSALLALAKGGFGVQIVGGDPTRIVAVRTGLFAAGQVEISGPGIAEGATVGVPK